MKSNRPEGYSTLSATNHLGFSGSPLIKSYSETAFTDLLDLQSNTDPRWPHYFLPKP